jgi:hypothetical protein
LLLAAAISCPLDDRLLRQHRQHRLRQLKRLFQSAPRMV